MKSKFKIIVSTSAVSLVAFAGLAAQDTLNSKTDRLEVKLETTGRN